MPKLIFLGTANAIADETHENTHMVVVGKKRTVLIDCVDGTNLRLKKVGLDTHLVNDLILTHFHPDHVSGVPQILLNMRLTGRSLPLNIYGLQYTLDRIEQLMGSYNWTRWPNEFPVNFNRLPEQEMVTVLEHDEFSIFASPVKHWIPTLGLRIEFHSSHKVVTYSCDTEPCPQLLHLAEGAELLIHEASGPFPGHSSAEQAGKIAAQAGVKSLYLIHYPTGKDLTGDPKLEAQREFAGPVTYAEDLMSLSFD